MGCGSGIASTLFSAYLADCQFPQLQFLLYSLAQKFLEKVQTTIEGGADNLSSVYVGRSADGFRS